MKNELVHLIITSGEPAGIGPEISLQAAKKFVLQNADTQIYLLGDQALFEPYLEDFRHKRLQVIHLPLRTKNVPGLLNSINAPYVLEMLDQAYDGCVQGKYDALVTAPIQKSVINDFGVNFTGHTEYLADKAGNVQVVMMLCGQVSASLKSSSTMMRVAIACTHVALKDVPASITYTVLLGTIKILHQSLKQYFGIELPKIEVAGLNPHAGESGYLGKEELEVIAPVIREAQNLGINITGPFSADTMFRLDMLDSVDVFLAMYHDQGLIPLKMACFGQGVNVTLGLPIIRTSVDHGTAIQLAGRGEANSDSMYQALSVAHQMVKNGSSST
jgi:4-hydroxythreonine-4-phosphate dehydrogenase